MGVDFVVYHVRVGTFSSRSLLRKCSAPHFRLTLYVSGPLVNIRLITIAAVTLSLLMLARNVESNPGPGSSDAKLDKLQIAIESLTRNVNLHQTENYTKLNQINEGIASLGKRVTNLEAKVNEISDLKEGLASVRETLGAVECDLTSFKDRLVCLDEGLGEVSNIMRRNNLIFRGLAEKKEN